MRPWAGLCSARGKKLVYRKPNRLPLHKGAFLNMYNQPYGWKNSSGTQPFGSINSGDCMYFPRLYELREDHDLTQKKIAEYLTMHPEVYRRYEAGIREIPVWAVIRLAELYHVSTDYLLGLTDEKNGHA